RCRHLAPTTTALAGFDRTCLGEGPLGIVYQSDAISDPAVELVGTFPSSTHPAIIYPVAITTDATSPDANAFIEELKSPRSRAIFEKQGFSPF
ncbi:MAG TPA: substrate-binding domain-containing protein, partial [Actinomycetota bacterium]|nr:substrate-binding domain-containing protein [Actinomycetota bacterium]